MPTPRDLASLLAAADRLPALARLAALFGVEDDALPLPAADARALGAPRGTRCAVAARGPRRVLVLLLPADAAPRDAVRAVAQSALARAPHLAWAVVAGRRGDPALLLATAAPAARGVRIAALQVERGRAMDSDLDTLRRLHDASRGEDAEVAARWLELLGRDALGHRFFRALAARVAQLGAAVATRPGARLTTTERTALGLAPVARLLFLAFLESKGWLDADRDFLARHFARVTAAGGALDRRLLRPLCFGTLNTPVRRRAAAALAFGRVPFLNGGLFAPTPLERTSGARHDDDALAAVFGDLLARWRFTAREEQSTWSDAAVDPEMLGRAFESLMAADERRRGGAFYTPHALVRLTVDHALASALGGDGWPRDRVARVLAGEAPDALGDPAALLRRARAVRVLDPACGSGAFLVHVLERLAALQGRLGDPASESARRRAVLVRQLHGVDVSPMAVWLCELRLWLSTVVEDHGADPMRVRALPNLDRQIVVGDTLDSDLAPHDVRLPAPADDPAISRLRLRYARAAGPRKRGLGRALDHAERGAALAELAAAADALRRRRRELLRAMRAPDLFGRRASGTPALRREAAAVRETLRDLRRRTAHLRAGGALPFAPSVHFTAARSAGGFDLLVGNPPWVRAHAIPPRDRERLRVRYRVAREAAWMAGARLAGAGAGFAAQPELAAMFLERAVELAAPGGTIAFLLPAKLWRTLAGGGTRRLVARALDVAHLEDWSEAPDAFDAVTYPSLLVARRHPADAPRSPHTVVLHRHGIAPALRWCLTTGALPLDPADVAAPWLLLPPPVRAAFDRLRAAGPPLAAAGVVARPALGVKTGCNAAFLFERADGAGGECVAVRSAGRRGVIEQACLRPAVRGAAVDRWRVRPDDLHLLWTHDAAGAPLAALPSGAAAWLRPYRAALAGRSDARGRERWWSLFRLDAATLVPRVVWRDIGRAPAAAVLPAGDRAVPLNSCYVVRCPRLADADALAALLNSPLAAAWLGALAEPARGGYRRFLGWTTSLLPLPADWSAARARLAPIGAAARAGSPPDPTELLGAALAAYAVPADAVAPLLAWHAATGA